MRFGGRSLVARVAALPRTPGGLLRLTVAGVLAALLVAGVVAPAVVGTMAAGGGAAVSTATGNAVSAVGGSGGGGQLVAIAIREYEQGVADGTHHRGDPKYWRAVMGTTFVNGNATPWCACFVTWCADQAGLTSSGLFPWSAGCGVYTDWFAGDATKGHVYPSGSTPAMVGDLLVYGADRHHIGIVTEVDPDGKCYWTIEGNASNSVARRYHPMGQTGNKLLRPNYPTGGGGPIQIPEPYGRTFTFTRYTDFAWKWAPGRVYGVWMARGSAYQNHIATIDGRYLVACTTTYGKVGDYVTFYLDDGTPIECIIADTKSPTDANWNQWGHGTNVLEFEVEAAWSRSYRNNPGTSGWMPEWAGRRVTGATNHGNYC